MTEEQVREILAPDHEIDISILESIAATVSRVEDIKRVNDCIRYVSPGLIVHLPGVSADEFKRSDLIQPIQFFNLSVSEGQAFTPQFVFLSQRIRRLCSYAPKLRDIIDGRGNGVYQEVLDGLTTFWDDADRGQSIVHQGHIMERQLWRLQDLRDGGGFGFSVELFFLWRSQNCRPRGRHRTHTPPFILELSGP